MNTQTNEHAVEAKVTPSVDASWLVPLFLALCVLLFADPVSAQGLEQGSVPAAKGTTSFYGLTTGQVKTRFGDPDEVRNKPSGSTEWSYGRSVIFFSNDKVTAWSDAGELVQREKMALLKSDRSKRDDTLSEEWVNPWTPPKRGVARSAGIDEMIDQ